MTFYNLYGQALFFLEISPLNRCFTDRSKNADLRRRTVRLLFPLGVVVWNPWRLVYLITALNIYGVNIRQFILPNSL